MKRTIACAASALCGSVVVASTGIETDSVWIRGRTVGVLWSQEYTDSVCVEVYDVATAEYRRLACVAPGVRHVAIVVPWHIQDGALVRPMLRSMAGTLLAASQHYAVVVAAAPKVVAPGGEEQRDSLMRPLGVEPNPAMESVNVTLGNHSGSDVSVTDAYGKQVVTIAVDSDTPSLSMNCSSWAMGMYRVEVTTSGVRRGTSLLVLR